MSEAICLLETGERDSALALMDAHADLAQSLPGSEPHVQEFQAQRAQLLERAGRSQEAKAIEAALQQGPERSASRISVAARLKLDAALALPAGAEREAAVDAAIALLREALARAEEVRGIPDLFLGLTEQLNNALIRANRWDEAEAAVREAIARTDPETTPRHWLLNYFAMRHAIRRSDLKTGSSDIAGALVSIARSVSHITASNDAIALLAPHAEPLHELMENAVRIFIEGPVAWPAFARAAADIVDAPVLTARLRGAVGLPAAIEDPAGEGERLQTLDRETPATYIQTVRLGSEIALLTTRAAAHQLSSALKPLATPPAEIEATLRRLDFHLRNVLPEAKTLGLERVRGWPELAADLHAALADSPPEGALLVTPGPLGSVPFSLLFGLERPLAFAPSLGALVALRQRRRAMPGGLAWRPQSLFDFAVWRLGDKPALAEALAQAVSAGAAIAGVGGVSHDARIGEAADAASLLAGLAAADVTRVACHGRILPNAEAVDLLVAADGLLPPVAVKALENASARGHVLSWRRLAEVANASAVVFSSACDSGAAILHAGGERLGLERPLLAAGARVFVAPQWPVPAVAVQRLMSGLLESYLANPLQAMARTALEAKRRAVAAGAPPIAAHAPGVFGDGL